MPRSVPGQAEEGREENDSGGHRSISEPHLISTMPLPSADCLGSCRYLSPPLARCLHGAAAVAEAGVGADIRGRHGDVEGGRREKCKTLLNTRVNSRGSCSWEQAAAAAGGGGGRRGVSSDVAKTVSLRLSSSLFGLGGLFLRLPPESLSGGPGHESTASRGKRASMVRLKPTRSE